MPELPEVFTVVNSLKKFLVNQEIQLLANSKYELGNITTNCLCQKLKDKKIVNLYQRGKYIAIIFAPQSVSLPNFSKENSCSPIAAKNPQLSDTDSNLAVTAGNLSENLKATITKCTNELEKNKENSNESASDTIDDIEAAYDAKEVDINAEFLQNNLLKNDGNFILKKGESLLLVHLRMTGKLTIHTPPIKELIHTHLKFRIVGSNNELHFSDVRRFGKWYYYESSQEYNNGFKNLGIEPLSTNFSAEYLAKKAAKHSTLSLKAFLLDQRIIAGLGNIYADEICALMKANPLTKVSNLSPDFWQDCVKKIQALLRSAILHRGTSFKDYVDGNNEKGEHQNYLLVYGKKNAPCPFCQNRLEQMKVAGRTTTYCPICQSLK